MMATDESADTTGEELDGRRVDRKALIATIVAAAVLTVAVSWFGLRAARQEVRWADVGYSIVSPTEATSTFDVFLYADTDATCRIHALNARFAEVGYADVDIARASGQQQRITATITTVEPAVTAVVAYCTHA
jgi:nucleoid-associated protein YgaU